MMNKTPDNPVKWIIVLDFVDATVSLSTFFSTQHPLRQISRPSLDLRQFAKQDALQHTAIPAHLDRAHEQTHPNVQPHTCTHTYTRLTENTHGYKFAHFARMLQQDIKTLSDHIWYGKWITNEYIRAQCCIWAHEVCRRNLSSGARVCQCSCARNTEKSSAEVEKIPWKTQRGWTINSCRPAFCASKHVEDWLCIC